MVKKIRVIDEAPAVEEKSTDNDLMELAKTMDWKLWEMLQILQRFEKKIGVIDNVDIPEESTTTSTSTKK
jgi:hypothetical protein